MKKILFVLVFITSINTILGYRFYAAGTNGYTWEYLAFSKFESTIEVDGLFYTESVNFRTKLTGYRSGSYTYKPNSDDYEFNWTFELPTDVSISDCKILIDGKFVDAEVLDVDNSESNYQNGNGTPKLLLREYRSLNWDGSYSNFYQLKVSPINVSEEVELLLKYSAPVKMYWKSRRIAFNFRDFYNPMTYNPLIASESAVFRIIDYNNKNYQPKNLYPNAQTFNNKDNYWVTSYSPTSNFYEIGFPIQIGLESTDGRYLSTSKDEQNIFYQLSTLPKIEKENIPERKIVLAFDYVGDIAPNLEELKPILKVCLTDKDSLRIITTDFNYKWINNYFWTYSPSTLDNELNKIKAYNPKQNSLPFMLREIFENFNSHKMDGEIWFFSNSTNQDKVEEAMEIVNQTVNKSAQKIKLRIVDYAYGNLTWINNKAYNGNEFLYENLSRLSKGSFVELSKIGSFEKEESILDCLAPKVSSVEIDPIPENGLAYSRFDLNRGRANFNITNRYAQIGLFYGGVPFDINYYGNFYDSLYSKSIQIDTTSQSVSFEEDNILVNYWYTKYLRDELYHQPQTNENINYIIDIAKRKGILTPYTAFIVPGENGGTYAKMLTPEDTVFKGITDIESEETIAVPDEFSLSAYPNPFNPTTKIKVEWNNNLDNNASLTIYNVLGQEVISYPIQNIYGHSQVVTWNGIDKNGTTATSGIYLARFVNGSFSQSIKLMLIK